MSKTMADIIDNMNSPEVAEKNARYQNARDAVAWAYKMAQELAHEDTSTADIVMFARSLIDPIEEDLNKTLDVLKD